MAQRSPRPGRGNAFAMTPPLQRRWIRTVSITQRQGERVRSRLNLNLCCIRSRCVCTSRH